MAFTETERAVLAAARVARLATADAAGRPQVVPICFALVEAELVSPIDEKPKDAAPSDMRRVRDVRANPRVAVVVDHYSEAWDRLGWLQVRGRARLLDPTDGGHADRVAALRDKYDQYRDHDLETRPLLVVTPGHTVSWGTLDPTAFAGA